MARPVGMRSIAARAAPLLLALGLVAAVAGCGSGAATSSNALAGAGRSQATPGGCAATVLEALGHVAMRVYREGVSSERTGAALHFTKASIPLRQAVERDDPAGTRVAAEALIATGFMTSLRVSRGSRVLADVGAREALAPLRGTLTGAGGAAIGSFVTSVWTDEGLLAETQGIAESVVALRANGRSIAHSFSWPAGELPATGTLTQKGVAYRYTSYPAEAYPSGPLRLYLLRPIHSTGGLCGASAQDTLVNTLSRVARLIYDGETGGRAEVQVRRAQHDPGLLGAVARRDPSAARQAVARLLNQHIVRLRVSTGGGVLADVGGPYVLAPVGSTLSSGGRTIGSLVLSIQDDEGYLRLAKRLAGLDVLMYMNGRLVKNSLGETPGAVPRSGLLHARGRTFRVFTLDAQAFPAGPLRIAVLIPIPYS
jgi:hypothetical protein